MAKNNPIIEELEVSLSLDEQSAIRALAEGLSAAPATPPTVPIPTTDAERAALENELTNYSRKAVAKMTPEEAAPFHTRRYLICLALDGVVYDRATVRIPQREEERAALEHELQNSSYYPPNKIVEVMTKQEENAYYIRRRQIMFALRGEPDDTTPAAKEVVRRCCY
jgi:hypothetical protein